MVFVVMLAGVTMFYTTRLAAERDRAQREAAKAARVSEALRGLLQGADPIANRATPDGLTVSGLLDAATDRVQIELAEEPDAQADMLTMMGRTYRRRGHLRQGTAGCWNGARQWTGGVRAGSRPTWRRRYDLGGLSAETRGLCDGGRKSRAGAQDSAQTLGPEHTTS